MSYHALIFSLHTNFATSFRSAGTHRIATFLREHDWDVEVIDYTTCFTLPELKELIKSRVTSKTIFFGFGTFFNYWDDNISDLTAWMKTEYPDIKTVLGGQSVAKTPAKNIDYWIDSFGEYAIFELAKNLTGNGNSIAFDLEHFSQRKLIKSVVSYPAFPMQSLKVIMEKRDFLEPFEWLTVEFGRGCKFRCKFCNFPVLGVKGDHTRSSEDFIYNMKYNYDNFGIENYYVADETFNDSPEKVRKFADAAEQLNFRPFFSGFMRADLMVSHPETWSDLVRLNFGGQYYGIETFNHVSAKMVGKGMNPDRLKQGLIDIESYFKSKIRFRATISLIVGLPGETEQSLLETEEWLLKYWKDQALVVFPLDIEDINGPNLKNQTNISEFGKDIFKYGVRKMDTDQYAILDSNHNWEWRHGNYAADKLMWEHDTMNVFEANRFAQRLQDRSLDYFKSDNWSMNTIDEQSFPDPTRTKQENSKIRRQSINFQYYISHYKHKKLSWKP